MGLQTSRGRLQFDAFSVAPRATAGSAMLSVALDDMSAHSARVERFAAMDADLDALYSAPEDLSPRFSSRPVNEVVLRFVLYASV